MALCLWLLNSVFTIHYCLLRGWFKRVASSCFILHELNFLLLPRLQSSKFSSLPEKISGSLGTWAHPAGFMQRMLIHLSSAFGPECLLSLNIKSTKVSFLINLSPSPPAFCDSILPDVLLAWGKFTHKLAKIGGSNDPAAWHLSFKMQKQYKYLIGRLHNSLTEKELILHSRQSGICLILLLVCNLPIQFLQV